MEFTTDIRHISGKDNPVADVLSRVCVDAVGLGFDFQAIVSTATGFSIQYDPIKDVSFIITNDHFCREITLASSLVIEDYEKRLQLPTTDVLNYGCQKLVQALSKNFPKLKHKITR